MHLNINLLYLKSIIQIILLGIFIRTKMRTY